MFRYSLLVFALILSPFFSLAQNKLVVDDRTGILSPELEAVLTEKLAAQEITYTSMVDFRSPCSYHYAGLEKDGNDLILRIRDCDNNLTGAKNMGASISEASGEEQGLLLSFAIRDIISSPGAYTLTPVPVPVPAPVSEVAASPTGESASLVDPEPQPADTTLSNEHDSRYFFAPSAFNLKKGELYYNAVYFVLHDIQYGVSDNFSMGIGTSIAGMPLYLTPKLSFHLNEKNALGIGDLPMFGTWGTNFMGNLAYGVYTRGDVNGNFTIGAGHLWTNKNEITNSTSSLVMNVSALGRISRYIFFLTENYIMSANFKRNASFYTPDNYHEEEFEQRNTFWYGIMGVRIVSKNRNLTAWQVGLTYIVNYAGEFPEKYISWDNNARTPGDLNLFAIPTVTFTVKFGKSY